jgi:hypothetical protein
MSIRLCLHQSCKPSIKARHANCSGQAARDPAYSRLVPREHATPHPPDACSGEPQSKLDCKARELWHEFDAKAWQPCHSVSAEYRQQQLSAARTPRRLSCRHFCTQLRAFKGLHPITDLQPRIGPQKWLAAGTGLYGWGPHLGTVSQLPGCRFFS